MKNFVALLVGTLLAIGCGPDDRAPIQPIIPEEYPPALDGGFPDAGVTVEVCDWGGKL